MASVEELRQQVVRFLGQIGELSNTVFELTKKVDWLHNDGQQKDQVIGQLRDQLRNQSASGGGGDDMKAMGNIINSKTYLAKFIMHSSFQIIL